MPSVDAAARSYEHCKIPVCLDCVKKLWYFIQRSARGDVPVRVRRGIVTVEIEQSGIRRVVHITAGHHATNAKELRNDTKSLLKYFLYKLGASGGLTAPRPLFYPV
jgi:hypothetical protein